MMSNDYIIKCESISKVYNLNKSRKARIVSLFRNDIKIKEKNFFALHNINFKVTAGSSVGILGLNGSGKSTLSNILGGVIQPTSGTITSKGQPSLIAIGAGLNNNFTGIENIHYKCLMHGMTEKEIQDKIEHIISFSELDDFIYQPLKNYSSGMRSRLGFSIAIHTNPDILIVDEALSVGDQTFSDKCIMKMKELQNEGKTIFFVSHSASQIKKMCDLALWIHYGELKDFGDVVTVTKNYNDFIQKYKLKTKDEQLFYKKEMISTQYRHLGHVDKNKKSKPSVYTIGILLLLYFIICFIVFYQIFS